MTDSQSPKSIIESKLDEARKLIQEAESLADEHNLTFRGPIEAYGMGGTYAGKHSKWWSESQASDNGDPESGYWQASSQSC